MAVKVLVTGANGFIGRALCAHLAARGDEVVAAVRDLDRAVPPIGGPMTQSPLACARAVAVGEIGANTIWRPALDGVEAVVHAAAQAHAGARLDPESLARIFAVNVAGARALAEAASAAGVRRFVFLSTVKVLGETTEGRAPFSESDPLAPDPNDAYARAKAAAEIELADVAAARGLSTVILRPPLVYGPGARANFAALVRLVQMAPPLPFASIANRRSLLFLGNLVDAIALALDRPGAAGEIFLVRDGEDVSTPELIRKMAVHLHRPARLFPCPSALLRQVARLAGLGAPAGRLLDSLALDDRKIRDRLGWRPPYSLDQGLAAALAAGSAHPQRRSPSA